MIFIAILFFGASSLCSPATQDHDPVVNDFETAVQLGKAEGKPVLMVFSGSDWCKPCIRLRRDILESDLFLAYATEHLIILELDFPYKKKNKLSPEQTRHNEKMAAAFNPEGIFPLVLVYNAETGVAEPVSYDSKSTPGQFINLLNKRYGL